VLANNVIEEHSASRGRLNIISSGNCLRGAKSRNEDAILTASPCKPSQSTKGIVALIADGVSRAKYAAQASKYCTEKFSQQYFSSAKTWSTKKIIQEQLKLLNIELHQRSKHHTTPEIHPKLEWLTTFSGIIFKSATAHIFHVGDTQIARIRKQKIEILTQSHNQRLNGNNQVLTRAVGADSHLQVDYSNYQILVDDIFILTTDGVHNYLDPASILEILSVNDSIEVCNKKLCLQASSNGSSDNISCLVLKVTQVPYQRPNEIRKTLLQREIPIALTVGNIIDNFIIVSIIHQSSRSHIYLVKEQFSDKFYALKTPSRNFCEDELYLQGFVREAWVGSQIDHPAIMKVYPNKSQSQFLYHLCEYIEGQTLRQWMHDHPSPSIEEVRSLIQQIISALRIFKNLEIVHRDVKPENIMLDKSGRIKLIDYGTASVAAIEEQVNRLKEDHPLGSANYIAPETVLNLHSDYKSDLYSIGVIAYEMLSGKLPYPELTRTTNIKSDSVFKHWKYASILTHRSDLPFWIDLAIRKSVEIKPEIRYDRYSEFESALSKPNHAAEKAFMARPIIEKHPVLFWKIASFFFAGLTLTLLLMHSN
jgi:serine/threonine protein kinase